MFADWFIWVTPDDITRGVVVPPLLEKLRQWYQEFVAPEVLEQAKKRGDEVIIRGGEPEDARRAAKEYALSRGFVLRFDEEVTGG